MLAGLRMVRPMRVLIVDDHPMFRRGVRDILAEHPLISSIAEAEDGASAIDNMQRTPPDVAVFDLALPEVDGLQLVAWVNANSPGTACIVLTMYDDREYLDRALELGVRGYILKDDSEAELHRCLDAISAEDSWVSPRFGRPRGRLYPLRDPAVETALAALTPAQREVLVHIGRFMTSMQIATELGVSVRTVQNHRYAIARRLELAGPHELLRFTCRYGID